MTFIVFQDQAGDWRWQLAVGAGWIVAVSAESYISRTDCLYAAQVVKGARAARIRDANGVDLESRMPRATKRLEAAA